MCFSKCKEERCRYGIRMPAGCNNQLLDEPEGTEADKGIWLRGNIDFIPSSFRFKSDRVLKAKLLMHIMV